MVRKYPGCVLLAFVILGIVAADTSAPPVWVSFPVAAAAVLVGLVCYSRKQIVATGAMLGVGLAALSACHFTIRYVEPGPMALANAVEPRALVQIHGRVSAWPDLRADRTLFTIDVDSLVADRAVAVDGAVLLKVSDTTTALQRGDRVNFTGRIYPVEPRESPGAFDYHRYLRLHGVQGIVYLPTVLGVRVNPRPEMSYSALIDRLRAAILGSFERNLSPVSAALAGGFLIGETREIPPDVFRLFRDSGTFHLLAVSGSNVALVVVFVMVLLRPFGVGKNRRGLILLGVIVVFAGLCYGEPSVLRASLMAALVIVARQLGRPFDLNHVIAMTALVILLADPAQLFDVGFQLSFITAWGLILLVPQVTALFERHHNRRWYRWLVFPFIVALIAQIVSTPVVVYHFHRIPVISVVANLVICPLVALAVVAVLALLVADLLWPMLGTFVGTVVDPILSLVISVLHALGGDQLPVIHTESWASDSTVLMAAILGYLLLGLGVFALRHRSARRWFALAAAMSLVVGLAASALTPTKPPAVVVTLQRLPGGVMAIVTPPESATCDLVVTGVHAQDYSISERIVAPALRRAGATRLGRVFLLGGDYSAVADIAALSGQFPVDTFVIVPPLTGTMTDILAAQSLAQRPGLTTLHPVNRATPSDGYSLTGGGLLLQAAGQRVLFADRLDEASLRDTAAVAEVLVLGDTWTPAVTDWVFLRRQGYRQMVCSRVAQQLSRDRYDPLIDPDQCPPDYVVDLSRTAEHCLRLSVTATH